jgi:hypothetical protein
MGRPLHRVCVGETRQDASTGLLHFCPGSTRANNLNRLRETQLAESARRDEPGSARHRRWSFHWGQAAVDKFDGSRQHSIRKN